MIESREAVHNIDAILAVEGVDGVFIGPYDMSGSYGVIGQVDHPEIKEAFKTVVRACEKAGKAPGIHVVLPTRKAMIRTIEDGFTFIALGMDDVFLDQGAREALQTAREALA
jgi:2-keto-3-deoxy-L-rhamnonate aldolase RhmA